VVTFAGVAAWPPGEEVVDLFVLEGEWIVINKRTLCLVAWEPPGRLVLHFREPQQAKSLQFSFEGLTDLRLELDGPVDPLAYGQVSDFEYHLDSDGNACFEELLLGCITATFKCSHIACRMEQ
jgi:hypothetical protein